MKNRFKTGLTALALAFALSPQAFAQNTQGEALKQSVTAEQIQTIRTQDGLNLHLQKDIPQSKPKAVLVISHGLASHSGVFADFAKQMNENGIAVYRFDARGHGKSDGRDSIHINSYFEMVEDLRLVV